MHVEGEEIATLLLGEAVATTTYILNISPTKALKSVTLGEAW